MMSGLDSRVFSKVVERLKLRSFSLRSSSFSSSRISMSSSSPRDFLRERFREDFRLNLKSVLQSSAGFSSMISISPSSSSSSAKRLPTLFRLGRDEVEVNVDVDFEDDGSSYARGGLSLHPSASSTKVEEKDRLKSEATAMQNRWHKVWLLALEWQCCLEERLSRRAKIADFSFSPYMGNKKHKKMNIVAFKPRTLR